MNISIPTINALVLVLTGDNNISPYLSGPMLVEFFNNIGLAEIYYQGFPTRRVYAKDKLNEINNSPKIEKAINNIIDKRRFIDTNFNIEKVVNYLNEFLRFDGYEIIYKEINYKVENFKNKNDNLSKFQILKDIPIIHSFEDNNVETSKLNNIRISGDNMNKKVFVIYGRDDKTRKAFFEFLRSIGLQPIEWEQAIKLTGKSSPYIGEILEAALNEAKAIIVLFTPDEIAILKEEYAQNSSEKNPVSQPRPNVIFEAGMAIDKNPDRTIIVEIGKIRDISDITGRHVVKFDGTSKKRKELIIKLNNAGCNVDDSGSAWLEAGDFTHITRNKQNLLKKIENFQKQTQIKKEHPKFKLHSAIYGTDEFFFDVYDKLNSMVNKNGLTVTSSNKIAGDPHKKAKKKLIIRYESYGKEYKVEVPEKETRTLP